MSSFPGARALAAACSLLASVCLSTIASAQATGDYRSAGSGNWGTAATWERFNGSIWVGAGTPTNADGVITIRSPHVVAVAASVTADQVIVDAGAQITVQTTRVLTLNNGALTDLTINGTVDIQGTTGSLVTTGATAVVNSGGVLQNAGTITSSATTLSFGSGGKYRHNSTAVAGAIPTATWNAASTCEIAGYTTNAATPTGLTQTFGHFVWNCPGQTVVGIVALGTGLNGATVQGDFTVTSTGAGQLVMASGDATFAINGNYAQTGGTVNPENTNARELTLNLGGNFSVSPGASFTQTGGNGTTNAYLNFIKVGTAMFTNAGTMSGRLHYSVGAATTLDMGTSVAPGAGNFVVNAGSTLGMGSTAGITTSPTLSGNVQVAGTRTFPTTANYAYTGVAAQNTGNALPATVASLTINNSAGVTLFASTVVSGAYTATSGALAVGTNTLTLNGAVSGAGSIASAATGSVLYNQGSNGQGVVSGTYGNLTFSNFNKTLPASGTVGIAGTFTNGSATGHTIAGSTVDFDGAGPQTIPAFSFNNLTSSNSGTRTLSGLIKIAGAFTPGTNSYTITGSTIEYNGASAQSLPSGFPTYNNVTVNNAAGASLGGNVTASGVLALTNGVVSTGASVLTVASTGSVTRSTGHVNGNLRKTVSGAALSPTFEVGDAALYAPVNLAFTGVTTPGTLTASTTAGDHGSIATSAINAAKSVNRSWKMDNAGIVFGTYNVTLNFNNPADVDGGASTGAFRVAKRDGSTWALPATGTQNPTNTQATGLTSFSEFAIGELKPSYTLTYTAGANGTITGTSPQSVYQGLDGSAVTAVPDAGYHFVNWSDASTDNPRTDLAVTGDVTVTANFAINQHTLTYSAGANGSITGTSPQTVNHGADGSAVTAVPDANYHFVNWSDASTDNPRTDLAVTGDVTVTANFAINQYTLAYTAGPNGSLTGTSPQTVNHGADGSAVTAVPDAGYHFVNWSDASTDNPRTDLGVTGDVTVTANFAINQYTLAYTAGPNGSLTGTSPQTVNHGADGSAVTAVPDAGYHFVNWSDASTDNPRTDLGVTGDVTVTANFAITQYTLAYTAGPNGSITGTSPQTVDHGADGSAVSAVPDANYHFVNWSDASTDNPRTDLGVTGDVTVTANFAINQYTLTYSAGANGSITGTSPQTVDHGADGSAVTAVPDAGYHFVNWSDASTDNPRTDLGVTGDVTVTANFAITQYTLAYTAGPNGSITGTSPQTVNHGADGSAVTAVPDANYHFVNWSDASTDNPRTDLGVTGDITVTANFAIDTHALTYTAGANGSITGTSPQTVDHGADGSAVTAVPDANYHFVNWSDASTDNPRTDLAVTADVTVTANFAINQYTLAYTAGPNGSITGTSPQTVDHGADGSAVTAVPDAGYHFVNWSDASTDNPRTDLGVTGDVTVTANFAINQYTLAYTAGANGSITGSSPQTVNHGTDGSAVTAVPDANYHFVNWSDASTDNPRTDLGVTGDITVTANFAIDTHTLTYTAGANGSITGSSPQTVNHGADGSAVTAVPDANYHFVNWSDASTDNPRTDLGVTGDITVTANFAINQYTLAYTAGPNGSISGTSPQTINHGADGSAVTAVPDAGYHFVNWSDASTDNPRTDLGVTGDVTVTANFAINQYTLAYTAGPNGSITGTSPQTVNHGADGSAVTAVPDAGYHFVNWSDASTDNPRTDLGVTGDITVTANFDIDTYTLTVMVAGAGSVVANPTGTSIFDFGTSVDLQANPDAGYTFVGWGGDLTGSTNPETVVMNADKSVTATFADQTNPVTELLAPNGSETFYIGTPTQITWSATDAAGVMSVDIYLARSGVGGSWETLATGEANDGAYDWTPTGTGTANAFVRVVAHDAASNDGMDESDQAFVLIDPTPTLLLLFQTKPLEDGIEVRWEFSDAGMWSSFSLQRAESEAGPWTILDLEPSMDDATSVVQDRTTAPGGKYVYRLKASTADGQTMTFGPLWETAGNPIHEFALTAVSPNPTPGAVRIDFAIPRDARARLSVVDVQGRELASLVDGNLTPGRYQAIWNGESARGKVGAGVYYIRFEVPGHHMVKKLVVVR